MRATFSAYSSRVIAPTHGPGPRPTWKSKHGRAGRRATCAVTRFHSAQVARQIGTMRRTMSMVSRAARASVYGPK